MNNYELSPRFARKMQDIARLTRLWGQAERLCEALCNKQVWTYHRLDSVTPMLLDSITPVLERARARAQRRYQAIRDREAKP